MGRKTAVNYDQAEVVDLIQQYANGTINSVESLRDCIREVTGVPVSTMSVWRRLSKIKALKAPKNYLNDPCVLSVLARYKKDLLSTGAVAMELKRTLGWDSCENTVSAYLKAFEDDHAIDPILFDRVDEEGHNRPSEEVMTVYEDGNSNASDLSQPKMFRENSIRTKRCSTHEATALSVRADDEESGVAEDEYWMKKPRWGAVVRVVQESALDIRHTGYQSSNHQSLSAEKYDEYPGAATKFPAVVETEKISLSTNSVDMLDGQAAECSGNGCQTEVDSMIESKYGGRCTEPDISDNNISRLVAHRVRSADKIDAYKGLKLSETGKRTPEAVDDRLLRRLIYDKPKEWTLVAKQTRHETLKTGSLNGADDELGQLHELQPELVVPSGESGREPELVLKRNEHTFCGCKQFYEAIVELHKDIVRCVDEMREMRNEMRQVFGESVARNEEKS